MRPARGVSNIAAIIILLLFLCYLLSCLRCLGIPFRNIFKNVWNQQARFDQHQQEILQTTWNLFDNWGENCSASACGIVFRRHAARGAKVITTARAHCPVDVKADKTLKPHAHSAKLFSKLTQDLICSVDCVVTNNATIA